MRASGSYFGTNGNRDIADIVAGCQALTTHPCLAGRGAAARNQFRGAVAREPSAPVDQSCSPAAQSQADKQDTTKRTAPAHLPENHRCRIVRACRQPTICNSLINKQMCLTRLRRKVSFCGNMRQRKCENSQCFCPVLQGLPAILDVFRQKRVRFQGRFANIQVFTTPNRCQHHLSGAGHGLRST